MKTYKRIFIVLLILALETLYFVVSHNTKTTVMEQAATEVATLK
jgi:hypothetical protein